MKYIFFLLFISNNFVTHAQKHYESEYISYKADSIFTAYIPDSLRIYFTKEKKQYYDYINKKHTFSKKILPSTGQINDFVSMDVCYTFSYPLQPELEYHFQFTLDSNLEYRHDLNLNFIPQCIKEKKQCNLISQNEIKQIALDSLQEKSITDFKIDFFYSSRYQKYVYSIVSKYNKTNDIRKGDAIELLYIDAFTKRIVKREFTFEKQL